MLHAIVQGKGSRYIMCLSQFVNCQLTRLKVMSNDVSTQLINVICRFVI
jgi:hypothetical protein